MNVSSLNSSTSTLAVGATSTAQASADVSALTDADAPPAMSQMADVMAELQDLQSTDPARFKEVTGKISEKLKSQATATGDAALARLSDKFAQAADSGSMDALKPQGHPHAGGHHHHKAQQAYQANGKQGMAPDDLAQLLQQTIDEVNGTSGSTSSASSSSAA